MLTAPAAVDINFDDDSWGAPPTKLAINRAVSVGNSWGVTSIGRGFNWAAEEEDKKEPSNAQGEAKLDISSISSQSFIRPRSPAYTVSFANSTSTNTDTLYPATIVTPSIPLPIQTQTSRFTTDPLQLSPAHSPSHSPRPSSSSLYFFPNFNAPPRPTRSPSSPRPRRRSSQQRVSLIAGRLSIAPIEPPSPPPVAPQKLIRSGSTASLLSLDPSARPPTPSSPIIAQPSTERSISEFVIQGEIGRGAYGLVKKVREMKVDGMLGPPLVIKQVIKSRILADCWKKHPKHGTIPIEIYVMSAISNTSYILPPRRPWDPSRIAVADSSSQQSESGDDFEWNEGKVVKGHPNICPLLDFFEDNHYYYLVLPSTIPEPAPNSPIPPSDLFDLVESYPNGLPPSSVRTYLGQIADAMSFLHSKGIVHRDIKDENVILGLRGRCILIDFGSSGLVRKGGWDTFSGTLDYAGPEILRGERYQGPEQDVWAFGVVAYVMLVGECPFTTAAEAQEGLTSPLSNASIALDERCLDGHEAEGEEPDGGGALGDAAALVRACLQLEVSVRPTFDKILESRFLSGRGGWGIEDV
ncbi:kinase-like protein [Multifurca ochricompacta]|uniref:Kinase-like protein n=1 Tax=Multifurca ochricompacta TaxID=376703 RepID=A0AAD4MD37_9AGAM|nr:kinase-like protein [Multifurca ochricompacta]